MKNSHRLQNISQRTLHSKQRILQSPLHNKHHDNRSVFFYHDKKKLKTEVGKEEGTHKHMGTNFQCKFNGKE